MPLLERKVNVVWSKLCYPFDDRWILFQKTWKRRKKRKCVSTTKDVVTYFILQLSCDFQSRIASCPDCQHVEVTDVAFKYRKKKNGRGESVDVLRLMNHSAKSVQRKVKKFTSHTVACKLRRISGGRVAPPVTFRVQRSDDRKYVCVCRLATQGIVSAVVRSGLNVRLLKLPIQIPLN